MKNAIYNLREHMRRLGSLARIMPLKDTVCLTFLSDKPREFEVYLTPVKRNIVLRGGTSDLSCLRQVFVAQEYKTPYRVNPKVIIDAGANIGMATLFFANEYPQARIVAIEPEASNFAMLTKNCSGLPNVTLVNAALWPTKQTLVIKDSSAEKWSFSVTTGANKDGMESVKAVTISGILNQLGAEHIDILKLDIEGAERELFNKGAEAWLGVVGQIIIELHDKFTPGCASALYSKIVHYPFIQEIRGENVFINFKS